MNRPLIFDSYMDYFLYRYPREIQGRQCHNRNGGKRWWDQIFLLEPFKTRAVIGSKVVMEAQNGIGF